MKLILFYTSYPFKYHTDNETFFFFNVFLLLLKNTLVATKITKILTYRSKVHISLQHSLLDQDNVMDLCTGVWRLFVEIRVDTTCSETLWDRSPGILNDGKPKTQNLNSH